MSGRDGPAGWLAALADTLREQGPTATVTVLIASIVAVLGAAVRKAFTNEAVLARVERELADERDRVGKQRAEDRKADAERLARIEADIRAMRDLMFEAFRRGRTD